MKLSDYMRANRLTNAAFASLIGTVTASAVRKWRYGERAPRLGELLKIQQVTNGQVAPSDFMKPELERRAS